MVSYCSVYIGESSIANGVCSAPLNKKQNLKAVKENPDQEDEFVVYWWLLWDLRESKKRRWMRIYSQEPYRLEHTKRARQWPLYMQSVQWHSQHV